MMRNVDAEVKTVVSSGCVGCDLVFGQYLVGLLVLYSWWYSDGLGAGAVVDGGDSECC